MDLIDRQAAIDAFYIQADDDGWWTGTVQDMEELLKGLPSAQPEHLTDDDFETIRIHLSAYKEQLGNQSRWKEAEEYQRIIDRFMSFASAQPEPHESFTDLINRQMAIDEAYAVIVDDAVYDVVQVETLEALPSVDAVEVVRCKDCIYWHEAPAADGFNSCEMDALIRHEMFFCANGERKDG